MNRGWSLEHEIVRQFCIDSSMYHDIHQFLGLFVAAYSKMGTEIPCEGAGKILKRLLTFKEGQSPNKLKEDWIVYCNGPRLSDSGPLIDAVADDMLKKHRAPIIQKSIFNIGQVCDRIGSETSKFEWRY